MEKCGGKAIEIGKKRERRADNVQKTQTDFM